MGDRPKTLLLDLSSLDETRKPARKGHNVYLDISLFKAFKRLCEARGQSASKVIEKLITAYLAAERESPDQG